MKKTLALLLAMVLIFTIFPSKLFELEVTANTTDALEYLSYYKSNGEITITDCLTTVEGNLVIPDLIDGCPIKAISSYAFEDCKGLTSIVVPDSVKEIGYAAFHGCSGLAEITLPFVGNKKNPDFSGKATTEASDVLFGYIFGSESFDDSYAVSQCYAIYNSSGKLYKEKQYGNDYYTYSWLCYDGGFTYNTTNLTSQDEYLMNHYKENAIDYYTTIFSHSAYGDDNRRFACSYGRIQKNYYRKTYYLPKQLKKVTVTNCNRIYYGAFSFCDRINDFVILDEDCVIDYNAFYNCFADYVSCVGGSTTEKYILNGYLRGFKDNSTVTGWSQIDGKGKYVTPECPVGEVITDQYIELVYNPMYEYSKDGITWQASNIFNNLQSETEYTFYQRYKEKTKKTSYGNGIRTILASDASETTMISTKSSLKKIEITSLPNKLEYVINTDELNVSGGTVLLTYENGETDKFDLTEEMTKGFNNNSLGKNTVMVSINGVTTTFDVEIVDKDISSLYIDSIPQKTIYEVYEDYLDVSGGQLEVHYTNAPTELIAVTSSMVRGFDNTVLGEQTLTITYREKSVTYKIYVKENLPAPSVPTIFSKTTNSITLNSINGYLYSKDGKTWTDCPVFEGLSERTAYKFYQKKAKTDTSFETTKSSPLIAFTELSEPLVESISATSITVKDYYGLQYSMDGVTWQASNVFSNLKPNTTYMVYQRVSYSETSPTIYEISHISVTTPKLFTVVFNGNGGRGVPDEQQVSENEDLTLNNITPEREGYKFVGWNTLTDTNAIYQLGNTISISDDTTLFAMWLPQCDSCEGSGKIGDVCTTCSGTGVVKRRVCGKCNTSDKIAEHITGTGIFAVICDRCGAINNYFYMNTGCASCDEGIAYNVCNICNGNGCNRISSPTVVSFTDTEITILAIAGCEYSINGIDWQASNVFTNLFPATAYTIYQRVAATTTIPFGATSDGIIQVTDKTKQTNRPCAPTLESVTSSTITLTIVDGCEYSMDGRIWQSSNKFSGLSVATEYLFYQRYKMTGTLYASEASDAAKFTTDRGTQAAPIRPTLSSKTHNCVTLVAYSGYEYSMDGINWQTSNVFIGLNPETNYLFYQRKAETNRYYASASSISLTVKTNEEPQYITGDFNNDEAVTDADALYLHYHTISGDTYPIEQDCDYNKDGAVTDADALYLLYHTIFGDSYPLN